LSEQSFTGASQFPDTAATADIQNKVLLASCAKAMGRDNF